MLAGHSTWYRPCHHSRQRPSVAYHHRGKEMRFDRRGKVLALGGWVGRLARQVDTVMFNERGSFNLLGKPCQFPRAIRGRGEGGLLFACLLCTLARRVVGVACTYDAHTHTSAAVVARTRVASDEITHLSYAVARVGISLAGPAANSAASSAAAASGSRVSFPRLRLGWSVASFHPREERGREGEILRGAGIRGGETAPCRASRC